MHAFVVTCGYGTLGLVLLLGLSACNRGELALSQGEKDAVSRLERDPWTDVQRVERTGPQTLMVTTRQGEDIVAYQLIRTINPEGAEEITSQRLPIRKPWNSPVTPLTRDSVTEIPPYIDP